MRVGVGDDGRWKSMQGEALVTDIPVPNRIHRDDRAIVVTWTKDHVGTYPARELRLNCHCATCREEMTGKPLLDPQTIPPDVRPLSVQLVGSYAIRIDWSDGHNTGIYTYEYLKRLCPCSECEWERRQERDEHDGMTA